MQCQWTLLNMQIFAALSGCPVVTSDRTHTGTRRTVSLHSEHVCKDNLWVETIVQMNCFAIIRYTTKLVIIGTHIYKIESNRIASHRIASHRIASQRIASHRIASHRIASHRIASHRIASHRIASHRIASHRI